ncbi:hypothetical protein Q5P01_022089 [Channa striata]|uniref:Uncharacterized protein n=1 Tax=Channa striata TaxID=64152 RepID=A0AA88IXA2_CHASR|nr:hypothetical protein Q5P01_022089 [Channa striata]
MSGWEWILDGTTEWVETFGDVASTTESPEVTVVSKLSALVCDTGYLSLRCIRTENVAITVIIPCYKYSKISTSVISKVHSGG